jgi:hypothetical protein
VRHTIIGYTRKATSLSLLEQHLATARALAQGASRELAIALDTSPHYVHEMADWERALVATFNRTKIASAEAVVKREAKAARKRKTAERVARAERPRTITYHAGSQYGPRTGG